MHVLLQRLSSGGEGGGVDGGEGGGGEGGGGEGGGEGGRGEGRVGLGGGGVGLRSCPKSSSGSGGVGGEHGGLGGGDGGGSTSAAPFRKPSQTVAAILLLYACMPRLCCGPTAKMRSVGRALGSMGTSALSPSTCASTSAFEKASTVSAPPSAAAPSTPNDVP